LNKELKDIGLEFVLPSDELKPFIQCYWFLHANKPSRHKLIADGGVGIVFNFGTAFLNTTSISSGMNHQIIFTGPKMEACNVQLDSDLDAIGVRFLPGGAYPFLKNKIQLNTNHALPLYEKHLPNIDKLYSSLQQLNQTKHKITLLDNYFIELLRNLKNRPDLWSYKVVDIMKRYNGTQTTDELAKIFSLSKKQFERRLKKETGFSPKQLSRILRIQKARSLIKTKEDRSLTDISYDCDYFDQSHFIHDFKFFTQETAKEYLNKKQLSHFYNS